ncbi:MAG: HlyU family transcriptional regulator [Pseudomonadota bacterium]
MLKKLITGLLGGDKTQQGSRPQAADAVEYNGYVIISEPDDQSGQYRVSGIIRQRLDDGDVREHRFERSDMLPSRDGCDEMMVTKAKRYIDEVGEAMFEPDPRQKPTDSDSSSV